MALSNRWISLGRAAGYVAFFLLTTVFFIVVTFPDDELRQFVEVKASNAVGAPVSIDDGGLTGLGVFDFSGLRIRLSPVERPVKWPGVKEAIAEELKKRNGKKLPVKYRFVDAETMSIDASLASLLFGDAYQVGFEGDFMGGQLLDGLLSVDKETQKITVSVGQIDGLVLGTEQLLKGATAGENSAGYDLRGTVGGSLSVTFGNKPTDLRGDVSLVITGARIVKPTVPPTKAFPAPFPLTDIQLDTITLKLKIDEVANISLLSKRGRRSARSRRGAKAKGAKGGPVASRAEPVVIHFAEISSESEEIALAVDPRSVIRLAPGKPFKQATMDLHVSVQILPGFFDKKVTDAATGEASQPNKGLKMFLQQPKIRSATLNGVLGFKCVGPLASVKCGLERPRRGSVKPVKPKFGTGKSPKKPGAKDTTSRLKGKSPASDRKVKSSRPRRGRTTAAERARERAEKRRAAMEKKRAAAKPAPRGPKPSSLTGRGGPRGASRPLLRGAPSVPKIEPSPGAVDGDEGDPEGEGDEEDEGGGGEDADRGEDSDSDEEEEEEEEDEEEEE